MLKDQRRRIPAADNKAVDNRSAEFDTETTVGRKLEYPCVGV
ncbi:hypothetical protein PR003_g7787 [Phytophthora rubi]|uniref:Uncharacterized protein n=1 Tax=Phytophthora rubi TaxID=129364 RepID=A0A6A4FZB0_9STRA|nr:hypothetical protein PR002_g7634 [Phytophthora rubi]KAE9345729.1 hypothetical protein PR003_g7787 [Phytophthora rubi]